EPVAAQHETVLERTPSPQPVVTVIPNQSPSPKPTGSPHSGTKGNTPEPNNEEANIDQRPPHENPLSNPAQMSTAN
ncbi:hypothetical protein L195_g062523, partial [Trifolium pratense]